MIYIGIDIGSISTEVVILDGKQKILASGMKPSGVDGRNTASNLMKELIAQLHRNHQNAESFKVSTGYGRRNVEGADKIMTEITCHAEGAKFLFPQTDTILDIGGQDSKAIKLDENGLVVDFQMNDRCAAGTGRFLEVMAEALGTDLENLNALYFSPDESVILNSTCTVFAESEIISLLNEGVSTASIVKGLFKSIAERSLQLLSIINPGEKLTLTGGVIKNRALIEAIGNNFKGNILIPQDPQIVGALGAALLARKYAA